MPTAAIFRKTLENARRYIRKKDAGEDLYDPEMEALIPLLKREIPAHIHAHRPDDILTSLRLAKEFGIRVSTVHTTGGMGVISEIKASGIVPIIGYNYGARRRDRVMSALKWGVIYAEIIMGVGFLMFQLIPDQLLGLFAASEEMLFIGRAALRTVSWSFLLAGMCIIFSSAFQALGQGMNSLYVSLSRQIAVLLPAAWLLSRLGDVTLVWLAFPIAELASTAMSLFFMGRTYKSVIRPLDGPAAAE
jgi:Na+-driven multidrug efflux pump